MFNVSKTGLAIRWKWVVIGSLCSVLLFLAGGYKALSFRKKHREVWSKLREERRKNASSKYRTDNAFVIQDKEIDLENRKFPFLSLPSLSQKEPPQIIKSDTPYSVFVLFTHFDCGTCLNREMELWESFYQTFKNTDVIDVAGICNTDKPREVYAIARAIATYPIFHDPREGRSVFSELELRKGPFILLVENATGQIVYSHFAEVDNKLKSSRFEKRVLKFIKNSKYWAENDIQLSNSNHSPGGAVP